METIRVQTGKPYDVVIGHALIRDCGKEIAELTSADTVAIITDDTVDAYYSTAVSDSLTEAGFNVCKFVFPHGESQKNIKVLSDVLEWLALEKLTRSDIIVALGGGVVGDLAGFAASIYLRGINFVQIPTTLLAMVDSSVGGKTAIDLKAGKNLAGAFHQPLKVICDIDTLNTLPELYFLDGVAEAVKYGVIKDKALFEILKNGDFHSKLEEVISRCVEIKAEIVSEDEKETGERKKLNYGHTIGHGIELCSNMEITHGHAVAIGMAIVAISAERNGYCSKSDSEAIINAIKENHLPFYCNYSPAQLKKAAENDKKRRGNTISLIVPTTIGKCSIIDFPIENLEQFIADGLPAEETEKI